MIIILDREDAKRTEGNQEARPRGSSELMARARLIIEVNKPANTFRILKAKSDQFKSEDQPLATLPEFLAAHVAPDSIQFPVSDHARLLVKAGAPPVVLDALAVQYTSVATNVNPDSERGVMWPWLSARLYELAAAYRRPRRSL